MHTFDCCNSLYHRNFFWSKWGFSDSVSSNSIRRIVFVMPCGTKIFDVSQSVTDKKYSPVLKLKNEKRNQTISKVCVCWRLQMATSFFNKIFFFLKILTDWKYQKVSMPLMAWHVKPVKKVVSFWNQKSKSYLNKQKVKYRPLHFKAIFCQISRKEGASGRIFCSNQKLIWKLSKHIPTAFK